MRYSNEVYISNIKNFPLLSLYRQTRLSHIISLHWVPLLAISRRAILFKNHLRHLISLETSQYTEILPPPLPSCTQLQALKHRHHLRTGQVTFFILSSGRNFTMQPLHIQGLYYSHWSWWIPCNSTMINS